MIQKQEHSEQAFAKKADEIRQIKFQGELAHYNSVSLHSVEMFKSVIESGREALNSLVLVNGGGVIALLGFLGATVAKGLPSPLGLALTLPLVLFGIGVLFGALGFGARYLSQACYAADWKRIGTGFLFTSVLLAVGGYVAFGVALFKAYQAFNDNFSLA